MKSLQELNKKIRYELHLKEAEKETDDEYILDDPSDSDIDDEPVAPGVILRINNRSKINANIKNLEFEVYYSELAKKLTDDDELGFTFNREKAQRIFEIFLQEIGFFESSDSSTTGSEGTPGTEHE